MSRVVSVVLISAGSILLAFWGVARLDSTIASSSAIGENIVPSDRPWQPDTSLWSSKRIASFRQSLRIKSEPPVAVLRIPRIHIETPVFRGTDELTLNRGVGWVPTTAAPDAIGNTAIAGHRDGFFRALKNIEVNDEIELTTRRGTRRFAVRDVRIVRPANVTVLAPSREPTLTLITCYPFYFAGPAPKRFIVRAVAIGGR